MGFMLVDYLGLIRFSFLLKLIENAVFPFKRQHKATLRNSGESYVKVKNGTL